MENSPGIKIIKRVYKSGSLSSMGASVPSPSHSSPASSSGTGGGGTGIGTSSTTSIDDGLLPSPPHSPSPPLNDASLSFDTLEPDATISVPKTSSDTMALTSEQKESLIEKLETKKHKLKVQYKENKDKKIYDEYYEVCALLASVKECDAVDKVKINLNESEKVSTDFRKKFKELAISDFNRIIDLSGSKDTNKPDVSTETWFRGRTVVFKDKVYRPPPEDKLDKFKQKMCLKKMPSDLQKKMMSNMDGNLNAAHIYIHKPDLIKCKKYDPLDYKGPTSSPFAQG